MTDAAWNAPDIRCLGLRLAGETGERNERGRMIVGDTLLLLLNASHELVPFHLPAENPQSAWEWLLDTVDPDAGSTRFPGGTPYDLQARSVAVLRLVGPGTRPVQTHI